MNLFNKLFAVTNNKWTTKTSAPVPSMLHLLSRTLVGLLDLVLDLIVFALADVFASLLLLGLLLLLDLLLPLSPLLLAAILRLQLPFEALLKQLWIVLKVAWLNASRLSLVSALSPTLTFCPLARLMTLRH